MDRAAPGAQGLLGRPGPFEQGFGTALPDLEIQPKGRYSPGERPGRSHAFFRGEFQQDLFDGPGNRKAGSDPEGISGGASKTRDGFYLPSHSQQGKRLSRLEARRTAAEDFARPGRSAGERGDPGDRPSNRLHPGVGEKGKIPLPQGRFPLEPMGSRGGGGFTG